MSKKITQEEFLNRFYQRYPDCKIKIIEYTAISNPCIVQCCLCGKILKKEKARQFLNNFNCCNAHNETKLEKIKKIYKNSKDFEFVKQIDKDNVIVHHNVCGNDIKRNISACLDNPFGCKFCRTQKTSNMLSIEEVQKIIDEKFDSTIKILDYNGQLEKNHYKCLKCGLIFTQKQICLMQSRGCPKCDRFKSQGEKFIANYLTSKNIIFEEQVAIKELPRQHFDFALYDNNHKIIGFIEVNGEQHYKENSFFRNSLEKTVERDNRKRLYCKENNIPLYEIKWFKGKVINLDILPF